MKDYALDLWRRARTALRTAGIDAEQKDYDASASRAYYAAFYAVSAVLAMEGKAFRKHSGVEAAVHKDLVRSGRWGAELGSNYQSLRTLRKTGDYGGLEHVAEEQAREAIEAARRILEAAVRTCPKLDSGDPPKAG